MFALDSPKASRVVISPDRAVLESVGKDGLAKIHQKLDNIRLLNGPSLVCFCLQSKTRDLKSFRSSLRCKISSFSSWMHHTSSDLDPLESIKLQRQETRSEINTHRTSFPFTSNPFMVGSRTEFPARSALPGWYNCRRQQSSKHLVHWLGQLSGIRLCFRRLYRRVACSRAHHSIGCCRHVRSAKHPLIHQSNLCIALSDSLLCGGGLTRQEMQDSALHIDLEGLLICISRALN